MKGTLYKTEEGWFVGNAKHSELPLHPDNVKICNQYGDYSIDWDSKEVEFEIVTENYEDGKGCTYAKLINHPVDTNEMTCIFEPRTDTSSATICKHCGQEKYLHINCTAPLISDVSKMVEDDVVKLAEEYAIKVYHAFEDATWFRPLNLGYYAGYNKAKEKYSKSIPDWIYSRLCVYDKRNPDYFPYDEDDLISKPTNCACDNCFYGRTKMADFIIQSLKQPKP